MIVKHVLGGALLVAGTSIGAGMLALPVVTAAGGFFPALAIYILCWLFMTCTGLLILELCLKLPPDSNLVTMATTYLGTFGKWAAWILYLFLFYCLSIAYVSGGAGLLTGWVGIDGWLSQVVFVLVLAPFVYFGARVVDRLNLFLMAGLILSYLAFVFFGIGHVNFSYLESANWSASLIALPVVFTSFSYQGIIPSLTTYLKRDPKRVRLSIILGTSIAFCIYLIWEFLILGIVPVEGLLEAKKLGQTAVEPLKSHVLLSDIQGIGQGFAFFAITTSYLGVTLGLFDFLADGLGLVKRGMRKILIASITFLPPLFVSLINPKLFIVALVFAGGVGCALLLGLMPTIMTWISRYHNEGHTGPIQLFGGKTLLVLLALFVVAELAIELFH